MVKQPKTDGTGSQGPQKTPDEARQARLEAALRENLKRRKKQSRARVASTTASSDALQDQPPAPPTDRDA